MAAILFYQAQKNLAMVSLKRTRDCADALNMNISTLDDADTQSLEGGEATDNVMETSYEDDLEEMEIEMEMDEGQNTGDYMIVLEVSITWRLVPLQCCIILCYCMI